MTRVLGGLLLALAAATLVLDGLIHQLSFRGAAVGVLIVLTFAGVGLLIVRRQRASPIGWLMILFTALYLLGAATSYYAMLYYRLGHHALPLAPLALLLSSVQVPSFAVFPVVILLFPDGRLTSLRWRRALGAYAVLVGFVLALLVAGAAAAIAGHDVRLSPTGGLTSSSRLAEWFENPPGWLIIPVVAAIVIIGGSSAGWTGGSTGLGTTPTTPWPRSRRGSRTRSRWPRSAMTLPLSCIRPWSPRTSRCGSARAAKSPH
jgi:hypothetical protein